MRTFVMWVQTTGSVGRGKFPRKIRFRWDPPAIRHTDGPGTPGFRLSHEQVLDPEQRVSIATPSLSSAFSLTGRPIVATLGYPKSSQVLAGVFRRDGDLEKERESSGGRCRWLQRTENEDTGRDAFRAGDRKKRKCKEAKAQVWIACLTGDTSSRLLELSEAGPGPGVGPLCEPVTEKSYSA